MTKAGENNSRLYWLIGATKGRDLLFPLLSGGLLVLAFPKADLWPVAFVALVPLLIALRGAEWRRAALLGFIAGVVFFVGSLYWVAPTVVRYGGLPWGAAAGILLLLAAYLAIYFAGFGACVAVLRHSGVAFVLSSAGLWVTFELLRSHLFTGFPWNLLGYSQHRNLPLIQIAALTGVYGVSFVLAGVNAAIADTLLSRDGWPRRFGSLATAGLLTGGAFVYGWIDRPQVGPPTIRIALLQGNIPQDMKWDPEFQRETLRIYQDLTLAQADFRPDLVVWPETAVPFFLRHDPRRSAVERLAAKIGAPLLVGAPDRDGRLNSRYTVSAFLITPGNGITGKYDKIHLVPFGEYVPLRPILFFVNKVARGAIGDFTPGTDSTVLSSPAGKFGVSISYEIYFPSEVRRFVQNGAEFLVNITNDAWYGRTAAPYQHVAMTVFRAVENRRYLVRAANTGISAVVAPDGRIIASSGLFERMAIRAAIAPSYGLTLYARYGDVFAWGAASAVGIALLAVLASRVCIAKRGLKGFADEMRRWAAPAGSGVSTLSASFAAGCVGLLAPLGVLMTTLGLDWLHLLDIQMPVLYGATGLTLMSLCLGAWRHKRPWPVLLGFLGIAGILYPFHDALDVTVFRALVYGGSAALLLAAAWDFILCRARPDVPSLSANENG